MGGSGRAFLVAEMNMTNQVKIEGFTFTGGNATSDLDFGGNGGAIASYSSHLTIWECIFDRNTAQSSGGALFIQGVNSEFVNINTCIFSNNTANVGGAFYVYNRVYPNFINCTIVKNNASVGSGFATADADDGVGLINSIVWNNQPTNDQIAGSSVVSQYNRVPSYYLAINPGIGCISSAPRFVRASQDDYHLQSSSPCIDAGNPIYSPPSDLRDIDGERRRIAPNIEMGADEVRPVKPIRPVRLKQ